MKPNNHKTYLYNNTKNSRQFFGLQTIDDKLGHLLKPIFQASKKEFILINNLVKNRSQIVGNKYSKFCVPKSISFEKNKTGIKLTIAVFNSAVGFFIENNSEIIIERIATLYGFKSITKIIIKQEPKDVNVGATTTPKIHDEKINIKINSYLQNIENEELSATLKNLADDIFSKK